MLIMLEPERCSVYAYIYLYIIHFLFACIYLAVIKGLAFVFVFFATLCLKNNLHI